MTQTIVNELSGGPELRCNTTALVVSLLVKQTGVVLLLIGLASTPVFGRDLALVLLIAAACRNPAWALRSLAAGTMVVFISSPFADAGAVAVGPGVLLSVLKWVLLLTACVRSLVSPIRATRQYDRLLAYWAAVTAVLAINSLFVSSIPGISVFKTIGFSLGLLCVIRLAMQTWDRNVEMLLFVAEMGGAVFVSSVPLFGTSAGYSRNGHAFNGILNHPQALGVFLVMTGAATFAAAFKIPRLEKLLIICGLLQWSMIYFTGARTAMVAVALGGVVYFLESVVRTGSDGRSGYISAPVMVIAVACFMLVVTASSPLQEGLVAFIQKGDEQSLLLNDPQSALEASSRGGQIFDDLAIAGDHPLLGYGFGVDPNSELNMEGNGARLGGIPLSAPVEQGFLPFASVAQIGVLGSPFVFAFLLSMYRSAREDSGETSALFVAVLGVNLGEMIFYSVGGLGIFMWILFSLFAVSASCPRQSYAVRGR